MDLSAWEVNDRVAAKIGLLIGLKSIQHVLGNDDATPIIRQAASNGAFQASGQLAIRSRIFIPPAP